MTKTTISLITLLTFTIVLSGCALTKTNPSNLTGTSTQTEIVETKSSTTSATEIPIAVAATNTKATETQTVSPHITQMELILDDSGSMAALAGGKPKIDIAKESFNKIIDQLKTKEDLQVALRVYGHQNKECTNSVVEIPMSKIDPNEMKSKVADLKPLGYTPIYYSLTESVKDFDKNISGDKIVVLVTDGLESCNGDPCAAAKALKAGGVISQMHVVGFGMTPTELSTLKCIAEPFQGKVVGANNSTEFLDAMEQIMEKALEKNLQVSVVGADGKPLIAKKICVYPAGETSKETVCAGTFASKWDFSLQPGKYDLKAVNSGTADEAWLTNIEIKAGEIIKKEISFAEGKLRLLVNGTDGKPLQAQKICVYPAGESQKENQCAGTFTADWTFKLRPSIYDVKLINAGTKEESWLKNIDVKSGDSLSKTVTFSQGKLKITILNAEGKSVQANNICVYPEGETQKETVCAGTFTRESIFPLKPGTYDVKAIYYDRSGEKWLKSVEIKPSEISTQTITI